MLKKLLLIPLLILSLVNPVMGNTVNKYYTYPTNGEVTAINLNGNIDNIINVVNGGLDNGNINTASGFRLYEVLGVLPAAGTIGRTVFYTPEKTLNFDTGTEWYSAVTLLRPPVQGDIVYYNGNNWIVLNTSNVGKALITNGSGANPSWEGMYIQGDIEYHDGVNRTRLPAGTSGYFLKTQGAGANPVWAVDKDSSNVVYQWYGIDALGTTNQFVFYESTSLAPSIGATSTGSYEFWGVYGQTERTILTGKFIKIAGISTITINAKLWSQDAGGSQDAIMRVDVGGQNNTVTTNGASSATPVWVVVSTIDVSGLTNGTTYNITITLYNENNSGSSYCSAVVLTAS